MTTRLVPSGEARGKAVTAGEKTLLGTIVPVRQLLHLVLKLPHQHQLSRCTTWICFYGLSQSKNTAQEVVTKTFSLTKCTLAPVLTSFGKNPAKSI